MNLQDYKLNVFEICPGRYYRAMWFFNFGAQLSEFGQGGDLTALLWRLDAEPGEWLFQCRMRHYRGPEVWGGKDRRKWLATVYRGDESSATARAWLALQLLAGVAANERQMLEIRGDVDAYGRAVLREQPYWLHHGIGEETANKGGKAASN